MSLLGWTTALAARCGRPGRLQPLLQQCNHGRFFGVQRVQVFDQLLLAANAQGVTNVPSR